MPPCVMPAPEPPLGYLSPEQRQFVREAFEETLTRYGQGGDVEGALVFFTGAVGMNQVRPTQEDIAWAQAALSEAG